MIIVRKVNKEWVRFTGTEELTLMVAEATMNYADGRSENVVVDPYPVKIKVSASAVEKAIANGAWGFAELEAHGLKQATPFQAPEGKQRVGEPYFVEDGGVVLEVCDVEDLPPPPEPMTVEQKLANAGLSEAEFDDLVAKSVARQAER